MYEVAWLRSLLLVFGSTAFAVSTILTAFMAGLGAGSYAVGRWIDRRGRGDRPLAIYGLLELGVGAYALATPLLFHALEPLTRWIWTALHPPPYGFALLRFVLCFGVLFLPAALMGGTLPALARYCARLPAGVAGNVGRLYGVNTLGAFLGTVLAGFLLLPATGLVGTIRLAAAANLVVGLAALALARWEHLTPVPPLHNVERGSWGAPVPPLHNVERGSGGEVVPPLHNVERGSGGEVSPPPDRRSLVMAAFGLTGAAALMLEVAWTRVLGLVLGPSVYAFSIMLAAFLAGLGAGSVLGAKAMGRLRAGGMGPFVGLCVAAGVLAFGTVLAFQHLPHAYAVLFHRWGAGAGPLEPGTVFTIGLVLCGVIMLPPTLAMGALFPAALLGLGVPRDAAGRRVGGLYGANSAGAIAGAFAAGFVAIPLVGLQGTVLAAAWLYLAVAAAVAWRVHRGGRARWAVPAVSVALVVLTGIVAPSWNRVLMSSGIYHYASRFGDPGTAAEFATRRGASYEELFYREGLVSTVLVGRERGVTGRLGTAIVPSVLLINNGKIDASSLVDMPTQILIAHIPLVLHPTPRRVLVIGLASGTTAGSALRHEAVESLDVVEIEPAVVEAAEYFDFVNGRPLADPRTRLTIADGRTYLSLEERSFDVIISEPSNPWITGVSNLFTREFFDLAKRRLAEGGIYCQWVQMYGMSPENLQVLLRTFRSVFPQAFVFNTIPYTDLLLVGALRPVRLDPVELERRVALPGVRADLKRAGVYDAAGLLARGRMGPAELEELVAEGEALNTDDNGRIEFSAPLDMHGETRGANERLIELFARGVAAYLVGGDPAARAAFSGRLAAAYSALGFHAEARAARRRAGR